MAILYSPKSQGFSDQLAQVDRCQIALLREFSGGNGRLVLKGGMAMRALVGAMSLAAVQNAVTSGLSRAAQACGVRVPKIDITKSTATTVRGRLAGQASTGTAISFEVEVSGRVLHDKAFRRVETVTPPPEYAMAPFVVESYNNDMMAALKVAALKVAAVMADVRNVPRDISDLYDLALLGADASAILGRQSSAVLSALKPNTQSKLQQIDFGLARDHLLPYIPPAVRHTIDADKWDEYILVVNDHLERWLDAALVLAQAREAAPEAGRP